MKSREKFQYLGIIFTIVMLIVIMWSNFFQSKGSVVKSPGIVNMDVTRWVFVVTFICKKSLRCSFSSWLAWQCDPDDESDNNYDQFRALLPRKTKPKAWFMFPT